MPDGAREQEVTAIVDRLRSYADNVIGPVNTTVIRHHLRDAADEIERLCSENDLLRAHLREDVLLRLAVENGWEHEPNNPQGVWCCDEHEQAWRSGNGS